MIDTQNQKFCGEPSWNEGTRQCDLNTLRCLNSWGIILILSFVFILVCLRVQSNPANMSDFKGISPERAFADFIFASVILHLVVMNFIGWGGRRMTVESSSMDRKMLQNCFFFCYDNQYKLKRPLKCHKLGPHLY